MTPSADLIGPILFVDDIREGQLHLAALVIAPRDLVPPPFRVARQSVACAQVAGFATRAVWRARFSVPVDAASSYHWNGEDYALASVLTGDMRLAYVSCNGEEQGDLARDPQERNEMWRRLCDSHRQAPFALMLHGGDQIYADQITEAHPLSAGWPREVPEDPEQDELDALRHALREGFAAHYATLYAQEDFAWLAARIPSLTQWDDHDICDGWGSLPKPVTRSAVGKTLFSVAREATLIFQHGACDGDLPPRFDDPLGRHLGWDLGLPGLRIVAPDLRSQRSLTEVMGDSGWSYMERAAGTVHPGQTFLMSSVPLLGPRLSVVERTMRMLPGIQKYEDDLRDQWQSHAHRQSWIRMLTLVRGMAAEGADVTVLSGEIHLATRAEMALSEDRTLHQLVASGITHRPPPVAWARSLGALAALGEDPLPEAPISIHPLPGQRRRYTAERNALVLSREGGDWAATWLLEQSGPTPMLPLTRAS